MTRVILPLSSFRPNGAFLIFVKILKKITLFEQVARLSFQNRVWCYDYFDKNFLGSTPFSGSAPWSSSVIHPL